MAQRVLLLTASAFLFMLPASQAQITSTIQGAVTDKQGLAVGGAQLQLSGDVLGTSRTTVSDANGAYQFPNLPAGVYSLAVTHAGFATSSFKDLNVTLNRVLSLNVVLELGTVGEVVKVSADLPLLETSSSSTGSTVLPSEIGNMPINGRNYLDLLQLVPGVGIFRQADANSDNATPILGERANNTGFLIDGLPNENEVAGGAAAQFNQDTIAEFQVITTGYKAEFGHSSGGVVNVITKSGGNDLHGLASGYNRNSAFDSSDIPGDSKVPYLLRWDYDAAAGGAIVKDKVFWFASAENIHENQQLNFVPPANTPQFLLNNEEAYNEPTTDNETRVFAKFDETLGNHHLTEQANYTNVHVDSTNPLSLSTSLPSTRTNLGDRNLLLGFTDTVTFGDAGNPFILSLRGQYRDEPTLASPAHPQAGPNTTFNLFSSYTTGGIFGDLGQFSYGATFTPSNLEQKYGTWAPVWPKA
ncbi:MAG: TonB-dependent receptor [Candidatus Acidiferrum sp.]